MNTLGVTASEILVYGSIFYMLELARLCYGLKVLGDNKPVHNRDEDCGAAASIYEEIHPTACRALPESNNGEKRCSGRA